MRILHVVPGLNEPTNGIAVAAKRIAAEQRASSATTPGQGQVDIVDTREFVSTSTSNLNLSSYDEIWVHSMWLPETIRACAKVLKAGVPLVRMPHANLDPMRMRSKGWKKLPIWWLIERRLMNRAARVVVTCEAEREWCVRAGVKAKIEVVDLKRYFRLEGGLHNCTLPSCAPLHVLYLGRRHPLKGVKYLEEAVRQIIDEDVCVLKIVSDHTGEELEKDWEWCDVLCLPTLSENFGLVVAEALERGKRVITTDGAPAWAPEALDLKGRDAGRGDKLEHGSSIAIGAGGRLLYLEGYRDGSEETRVKLLKDAIEAFAARRD